MADSYPRFVCPNQCNAGFKGAGTVDGNFTQADGHATMTAEFDADGDFKREMSIEEMEIDSWDDFESTDNLDVESADELVCLKCGTEAIDTEDMEDAEVTGRLL